MVTAPGSSEPGAFLVIRAYPFRDSDAGRQRTRKGFLEPSGRHRGPVDGLPDWYSDELEVNFAPQNQAYGRPDDLFHL
jgi:hypothetical protein